MSPLEREAREAFDWLFIGDEADLARRRGEPAPIVPTPQHPVLYLLVTFIGRVKKQVGGRHA